MSKIKLSFDDNNANIPTIMFINKTNSKKIVDFDGELGETCVRYINNIARFYIGIGDYNTDESSSDIIDKIISAVESTINTAISLHTKNIIIDTTKFSDEYIIGNIMHHSLSATYSFDKYKTKNYEDDYDGIEHISFLSDCEDREILLAKAEDLSDAIMFSRDLQNDNANVVTPEYLSLTAIGMEQDDTKVSVLYDDELKQKGLNLIRAVGNASEIKPRLIIIEYMGDDTTTEMTALVGKGVTFDSGGLSLKPSASMEDMRMDMSGASTVLGFMKYVQKQKLKTNIVAVIPTAENAIGANAFRVGDVYKSYNGKTVEILNTDAEGRLILADALSYVAKNFHPTKIIDFATLTGAVLVALGDTMAGIFSNSPSLSNKVFNAGELSRERVWSLPIREEHTESIKSKHADLRNLGKGMKCGSITAAAFLQEFVEDIDWCHIDIAGTAMNDTVGGTGWGVKLLSEIIK